MKYSVIVVVWFAAASLVAQTPDPGNSHAPSTRNTPLSAPGKEFGTGDPVLPVNGEFRVRKVDLTVPSVGFPFSFVRCYRSGTDYQGPMGHRWDFNFNSRIVVDTAANPDEATRYDGGDNRSDVFVYNSTTAVYDGPTGLFARIDRTSGTDLIEVDAQGGKRTYELVTTVSAKEYYRLVKMADRNGNEMTLTYDATGFAGKLVGIRDTNNREYTLTYDSSGRLEYVKDFGTTQRKIKYVYDSNNDLVQVIDLPGETGLERKTDYTYDGNHCIVTITDPKEVAKSPGATPVPFVRNYWTGTTVRKQEYGPDAATNDDPSTNCYRWSYYLGSSPRHTVFTDRNNNQTTFYFDAAGLCTKKVYENGTTDIEESFEYDTLQNCTKIVKGEGNEQRFTYDTSNSNKLSRGNLLSVKTTASGGSSAIETTYEYETTFNQVTKVVHPTGREDTFAYDAAGNLTKKIVDAATGHLRATTEFAYNSSNRYVMTSATDARGKVTSFEYDTLRRLTKTTGDTGSGGLSRVLAIFEYDEFGNVTKTKDALNRATTSVVNRLNQTTKVTNALAHEVEYFYDASDNLTKTEMPNDGSSDHTGDFVVLLEYDLLDKVTKKTEDINASTTALRVTTYAYDNEEHLTLVTAPEGNKVAYEYNVLNLNTKVRWGDGTSYSSATTYFYDKNFRLTKSEPAKGSSYATTFAYDHHDRQTKVTNALGHYSQSVFTGALLTATESYASGGGNALAKTTFAYDTADRLTKTRQMMKLSAGGSDIDDGWRDSVTEYDLAGNVTKVRDDADHATTMVYDGLGRLSTTTDPNMNTTTLAYDLVGNVTSSVFAEYGTGGMSFTTSMTYDDLNRISTSTDPLSKVTTYAYDVRNLTKVTDPNGHETRSKYNEQGWLLESTVDATSSLSLTSKWEYDKNGRLTKTRDPKNYATTYFYDQLDRQTQQQFNDTYSINYTYDTHSNISTRQDQNNTTVTYHYDLADRLTKKTYSITAAHIGGESTQKLFAYDALNRMTSAEDSDSKILYTYNTGSLVESEEERYGATNLSSTGKTVEWDYNAQGLVTALRYPGASSSDGELAYVYDNSNRLIQVNRMVSSGTQLIAEWSILGAGRVLTRTNGNATRVEFQHDLRGSVIGMTHKHEEGSTDRTLSQFNYAYDDAGRMKAEAIKIYRNNGTTFEDKGFTFLYDKADRLTKLYRDVPSATTAANPPTTYDKAVEYQFDDNGNRNTVTYTPSGGSPQIETYTSNNTNAYTNVVWPNSTDTDYEYDKAGNRTWQTDTDRSWEYDYQNKLVAVSNGSSVYCAYDYDALGRRMEKKYQWSGVEFEQRKRFYYAGAMLIQEYDVQTSGETEFVTLEGDYVWGQSLSEPIQFRLYDIETEGLLGTVYYHQNLTGSVYQITDDSSSAYIEENYRYEEYGVPTVYVGDTTTAATEPFGNKLLWHAGYYDWEVVNLASGLSLYGEKRQGYDPEVGSSLSRGSGESHAGARGAAASTSASRVDPPSVGMPPRTTSGFPNHASSSPMSFDFPSRRKLHPPIPFTMQCLAKLPFLQGGDPPFGPPYGGPLGGPYSLSIFAFDCTSMSEEKSSLGDLSPWDLFCAGYRGPIFWNGKWYEMLQGPDGSPVYVEIAPNYEPLALVDGESFFDSVCDFFRDLCQEIADLPWGEIGAVAAFVACIVFFPQIATVLKAIASTIAAFFSISVGGGTAALASAGAGTTTTTTLIGGSTALTSAQVLLAGLVFFAVASGAPDGSNRTWNLGGPKSATKWQNQMNSRGWTTQQIDEAVAGGQSFPAPNNINPCNSATRFVHPQTGRSVVIDDVTKEVIHVGGNGFKYP